MSAVAQLNAVPVTQQDVEAAWATLRALVLIEVEDHELTGDLAHQQALEQARERFSRLFDAWWQQ